MNSPIRLYLLPGLGADPRIYNNLDCGPEIDIIALDWIPVGNAKNLADYAAALHTHYALEPPYLLGGVSLGGMIAQEWARLSAPVALVLISTVVSRSEMASLIRMAGDIGMGPILRKPLLRAAGIIGDRFTSKTSEGRALFLEMLDKSDADFMHFGAQAVTEWQPPEIEVPAVRVHGTDDKVFPSADPGSYTPIKDGTHFMIFDRGPEIGAAIRKGLEAIEVMPAKASKN